MAEVAELKKRVAESYKAAAAFTVSLAGLEVFVNAWVASSEQTAAHGVAGVVATIVGAAVWFVRNKPTFDQVAKALTDDPELAAKVAADPALVERVAAPEVTVSPSAAVSVVIGGENPVMDAILTEK